ncbi:hypothetical protein WOLCODRAFT_86000, partial [Wolfiporia cocos MD-104 SS10]
FSAADGWNKSSVTVRLLKEKEKWADESEAPQLEVPDVYHRSLLDIIKTVCRDPEASSYQWIPYKQFWRRPKNSSDRTVDEESAEVDDIRIYSELFNSDAMLLEYEKIRSQPPDPDDPPDTEVAIVPIMLWSDSTHLASFGSASLWPIYVFFGFISKYIHNKPTSFCAHHLAYVPSVSIRFFCLSCILLMWSYLSFLTSSKININHSTTQLQLPTYYDFENVSS